MNVRSFFRLTLIAACLSFGGCQSWQGGAFPLPNTTRVPPPGTGSYQLPSGYYNNSATSAVPSKSPTNQLAGTNPSLSAATAANSTSSFSGVSTANFTATQPSQQNASLAPAAYAQPISSTDAHSKFTAAPLPVLSSSAISAPLASTPQSSGASVSLSDAAEAEVPSLQWQQFDGQ